VPGEIAVLADPLVQSGEVIRTPEVFFLDVF